jgi:hypothetical protein
LAPVFLVDVMSMNSQPPPGVEEDQHRLPLQLSVLGLAISQISLCLMQGRHKTKK